MKLNKSANEKEKTSESALRDEQNKHISEYEERFSLGKRGAVSAELEIVDAAKFSQNIAAEPVYCICKEHSHGIMVACDNYDCSIEWFHIACVGLTKLPKHQWYCTDCTSRNTEKRRSNNR